MIISLNEDVINKTKTPGGTILTLPEVLVCLVVKLGYNPARITDNLTKRGILVPSTEDANGLLIFQTYNRLVEDILLDSDKIVPKQETLDDLVTALQELFPRERKPDAYGVPKYSYRGNKRDIAQKLQKFFKLYGEDYSYDDIKKATKNYVERYKYDKTYMKTLQYFIFKEGEGSQLATELENIEDSTVSETPTDWTNTLV